MHLSYEATHPDDVFIFALDHADSGAAALKCDGTTVSVTMESKELAESTHLKLSMGVKKTNTVDICRFIINYNTPTIYIIRLWCRLLEVGPAKTLMAK